MANSATKFRAPCITENDDARLMEFMNAGSECGYAARPHSVRRELCPLAALGNSGIPGVKVAFCRGKRPAIWFRTELTVLRRKRPRRSPPEWPVRRDHA